MRPMRRPNPIAENLTAAEVRGLTAHRRTLTHTADGGNAAAPRRALTQSQRKTDLREGSQKGDAA